MGEFEDWDFGNGDVRGRSESPLHYEQPMPLELSSGGSGWLTAIFLFTTLVFGGLYVRTLLHNGGDGDDDDHAPSGKYVAIFYDDDEVSTYSREQMAFLNSVELTDYLEEHTDEWHRIDVDDSVDKLPEVFRTMEAKHRTSLPWVVVVAGGKFASEPVVDSEQSYELFKKWLE